MKLLIPILVDVENIETIGQKFTPEDQESIRQGIENSIKQGQANGFSHHKAAEISIIMDEVLDPIPIGVLGPYQKEHEFDYEPTYIHKRNENGDSSSITLNRGIPQEIRATIAKLIIPILNTEEKFEELEAVPN